MGKTSVNNDGAAEHRARFEVAQHLRQLAQRFGCADHVIEVEPTGEVVLDEGAACVHLHGKGHKQRSVPLWHSTIKTIRAWLKLNPQFDAISPLLPIRNGGAMSRSAVAKRLSLAVREAATTYPNLKKKRVSPHTIRHATAMHLLQAGVDISAIALWLGHESPVTTHCYVEADLTMKERALARLHEPDAKIQRYRAPDSLIDFLNTL